MQTKYSKPANILNQLMQKLVKNNYQDRTNERTAKLRAFLRHLMFIECNIFSVMFISAGIDGHLISWWLYVSGERGWPSWIVNIFGANLWKKSGKKRNKKNKNEKNKKENKKKKRILAQEMRLSKNKTTTNAYILREPLEQLFIARSHVYVYGL